MRQDFAAQTDGDNKVLKVSIPLGCLLIRGWELIWVTVGEGAAPAAPPALVGHRPCLLPSSRPPSEGSSDVDVHC